MNIRREMVTLHEKTSRLKVWTPWPSLGYLSHLWQICTLYASFWILRNLHNFAFSASSIAYCPKLLPAVIPIPGLEWAEDLSASTPADCFSTQMLGWVWNLHWYHGHIPLLVPSPISVGCHCDACSNRTQFVFLSALLACGRSNGSRNIKNTTAKAEKQS